MIMYCTDLMSQQLGFEDFVAEVEESNKDFKQAQKVRVRELRLLWLGIWLTLML